MMMLYILTPGVVTDFAGLPLRQFVIVTLLFRHGCQIMIDSDVILQRISSVLKKTPGPATGQISVSGSTTKRSTPAFISGRNATYRCRSRATQPVCTHAQNMQTA
ncbi:hypothetical protein C9F78_004100 [Salmonella enterica subsp. enterica serovar 4,[5],12:b:-]|nr:hypothetical protein [Salmonella enterica subsp. enterica serovar 4,[5],12:b:-]